MLISDLPMMMLKCLICTIIIEVLVSVILRVKNKKDISVRIILHHKRTRFYKYCHVSKNTLYFTIYIRKKYNKK